MHKKSLEFTSNFKSLLFYQWFEPPRELKKIRVLNKYEEMWRLAEKTQVMMNQDFLYQINQKFSEEERLLLAIFTTIQKIIRISSE